MRTENLAILLTDIKGYTARTSAQTREQSRAYLLKHEAVVLPVIQGFGGTYRKNVGDAILATFPSPTNAVLAAAAVQDRLWSYNKRVKEEERLEIRAMLALGEVRVAGDDVLGEAVALVGKLDVAAGAGDVVFTEALYLAMNKAEVVSREIGLRQISGWAEPIKLFRVAKNEGEDEPPYSGKALKQLAALPAVDDTWVSTMSRDPKASLSREISAVSKKGLKIGRWMSMAALPIAVIAGLIFVLRAAQSPVGAIEDRIDRGELEVAKAEIAAYLSKHPERDADGYYLRGRVAAREQRWEQAANFYYHAIDKDGAAYKRHSTIFDQMTNALESEDCAVRSAAARTLGVLGDGSAREALEAALEREKQSSNFLSGLFCHFDDRAREALNALE